MNTNDLCPCGSALTYLHCCGKYHLTAEQPATPEALMRSRYSAFVLKIFDYLIDTHAIEHLQGLTATTLSAEPLPQWIGLEVLASSQQGDNGSVTFKAWYRLNNRLDVIFEKSAFIRRQERWFYTTGEQMEATLPSRNDRCVCGSGKKFKLCCGK